MIAIVGLFLCGVVIFYLKRRDLFKFSFRKALKFMIMDMMLMGLLGLLLNYTNPEGLEAQLQPKRTDAMTEMIKSESVFSIALAGLEDATFVLPLLLLPQVRIVKFVGIGVFSYLFMRGHDYQGRNAMFTRSCTYRWCTTSPRDTAFSRR